MNVAFIISCGKNKLVDTPIVKFRDIPLNKLYIGPLHAHRRELVLKFTKEYFYCTPGGPGIVKQDFRYHPYDSLTTNEQLADPEFIKMHAERLYSRYPDFWKYDTVFFIGNLRYLPFLRAVIKTAKVFPVIKVSLRMGLLMGLLQALTDAGERKSLNILYSLKDNFYIGEYLVVGRSRLVQAVFEERGGTLYEMNMINSIGAKAVVNGILGMEDMVGESLSEYIVKKKLKFSPLFPVVKYFNYMNKEFVSEEFLHFLSKC